MLLVTGATGFVGRALMKEISKKRKDIRILDRDTPKARELYPKFEIFRGDITRPETLYAVAKDVDTVIHLAGMVSYSAPKSELMKVNAEGTKNLLAECKKVRKIIFASSVSVYGEIRGEADESYILNPKTAYGESKLDAESAIRDSGIPHVVLRIAPIYGAGSPQWMRNLRLLEKGFPIPKTDNLTHVTHLSKAVQAFSPALKKGNGVYNIADEKPVKFVEFAETIVEELGKEPRRWPYWLVSSLARMKGMKTYLDVLTMNRNYVVKKAEKELGYNPKIDFVGEIKAMVEWYNKEKGK